jgi:hypothetical protein
LPGSRDGNLDHVTKNNVHWKADLLWPFQEFVRSLMEPWCGPAEEYDESLRLAKACAVPLCAFAIATLALHFVQASFIRRVELVDNVLQAMGGRHRVARGDFRELKNERRRLTGLA